MATPIIACSCGGGPMIRMKSKTKRNPNRWFLKCPLFVEHPNSFMWEDEASGDLQNEVQRGAQKDVRDNTMCKGCSVQHGGRDNTMRFGITNFLLCLIVILLFAIYVKLEVELKCCL